MVSSFEYLYTTIGHQSMTFAKMKQKEKRTQNNYQSQMSDITLVCMLFVLSILAFFRHLIGYHNNMVVLPVSNMRMTLHQVAAGYFPSLFLNEQDRKYFRPMSEDFATLLQETGYMHIQATKPDTVGMLSNVNIV